VIVRGGLTLVAALALAACAGAGARTPPPAQPQSTTAPPPAQSAPAVARRTQPAPPAAPKLAMADLLGQPATRIDGLLGEPDLVRIEGDGEFRIYNNASCVLHVFIYSRDGVRQATHAEARTSAGRLDGDQADDCVARFTS